jgi:Cytochrome oxidase complex assembly protein 1
LFLKIDGILRGASRPKTIFIDSITLSGAAFTLDKEATCCTTLMVDPTMPQPPSIPPATPPPIRRSWWGRNWKWLVPTGCLTLIGLGIIGVLAIVFTVFGLIKSSDPYKAAVARAKTDIRVQYALGMPIREGWYVSGETHVTGGSGKSDLTIPISGPKTRATIYAAATKSAGEWQFTELVVKVEHPPGTINLLEEHDRSN